MYNESMSNINKQKFVEDFEQFPEEIQREVIDFAEYLCNKRKVQKYLANNQFLGLWKDREEMTDSTQWVKQIREQLWKK